jgi:hypothetical protein
MVKYEFGKLSTLGLTSSKKTKKSKQSEFGKRSKLGTSLKKGNPKIKSDISPARALYPFSVFEKVRLPKFGKNMKRKRLNSTKKYRK